MYVTDFAAYLFFEEVFDDRRQPFSAQVLLVVILFDRCDVCVFFKTNLFWV